MEQRTILYVLIGIGVLLVFIGFMLRMSVPKAKKLTFSKGKILTAIDESKASHELTSLLNNEKKLKTLFRKSGNPWNLTPFSYNAIRWFGLIFFMILAVPAFLIDYTVSIVLALIGIMFFYAPKHKYENAAADREGQWNQLYQYVWVIKHNLTHYDPQKTFVEVGSYINEHDDLPELVKGFADFASYWDNDPGAAQIHPYLKETYGDFIIPKQLLEIILTSQRTGQYPNDELDSLRDLILEKMNFYANDVLSEVGRKATTYSSPFLMGSVAAVILVPVIIQVLTAFS